MLRNKKKNISGITLIELVIALGIMGLVTTTLYSLFTFSNRTFYKGEKQYEIQSDMRITMDSVVKSIRTATNVKLLSSDECKAEIAGKNPYNYIYIDGNNLYHAKYNKSNDSHSISRLTDKLVPNKSAFSRIKDDILGIELAAEYNGQTYTVNSETLLVNFSLLGRKIDGTGKMKGIKYLAETSADIIPPTTAPSPAPSTAPSPQPSQTPAPTTSPSATPLPGYPLWDASKSYPEGSYVIYNGAVYYARYYVNPDTLPGTMNSPWQEITGEWRHFNVYVQGDIVIYNGIRYMANWWTSGEIPGTSGAWTRLNN